MLKVGPRQMAALRGAAKARFVDNVARSLRIDLPREFGALSPDQARSKVIAGMEKAKLFGLKTERDVFRFVALSALFGEDFTRREWAARLLQDASLTRPSDRIAVLWAAAPSPPARV